MKSILKLFFAGCAYLTGIVMVLVLIAGLINTFFHTDFMIAVGPVGSKSWFTAPNSLIDILAWEVMLGVFFSMCLILSELEWIWEKMKKYPVWGALCVIIYASLIVTFFYFLMRDIGGGDLNTAIEKNDKVVVEELIKKLSPSVEKSGYFFIEAARFDSMDVIPVLVKNGYDINAGNAEGTTALMAAAGMWFRPPMVEFLLENVSSVDVRDAAGNTALLLAIKNFDGTMYSESDLEMIVRSLVAKSKDKLKMIDQKDNNGVDVYEVLKGKGPVQIVTLLQSFR
ncbi:MAG: ankyrin repeat domain-containing protein [Candidatus Peregrinibacteria bacterium]|nr:ankyrin repeat domain-containing protein [Candidatus Peregrinibacteria bacterium]